MKVLFLMTVLCMALPSIFGQGFYGPFGLENSYGGFGEDGRYGRSGGYSESGVYSSFRRSGFGNLGRRYNRFGRRGFSGARYPP